MAKTGDLYLLANGTHGAPGQCSKDDDDGVLRHENGVPVSLTPDGSPVTISQRTEETKEMLAAEADHGTAADDKSEAEAKPAATRDVKAD